MATPESEAFVHAFARGLSVIEALSASRSGDTLNAIAAKTGLSHTAVRRFLMTLIALGMVRSDDRRYWLTPRVLRLGLSYLVSLPYWREAQLALEELSTKIDESCALSVLDDGEIVYLQRHHAKRILPMSPTLGSRMPAYCVSMGRVLLSGLSPAALQCHLDGVALNKLTPHTIVDRDGLAAEIAKVSEQGFAWGSQEFDESIAGLAVPVRDMAGHIIAAVNVSLPAGEFDRDDAVDRFLPALRHTAARIRASTAVG